MSPATVTWPIFVTEAERFFNGHLARPRKLFASFVPRQVGSGRPAGPRELYWPTTIALAVAALEAGLEDLLFAAHGARQNSEGDHIVRGRNCVDKNPRKWLVEDRLITPNRQKVDRVLFSDFGVILEQLPACAQFTARRKPWSRGGAARGEPVAGPDLWSSLGLYLDVMAHIRNATAHGDATKLGRCPDHCEGVLWLQKEDGNWSVQLPHALTALRATLAVFNTVADGLAQRIGHGSAPRLTQPDNIDFPDA